MLLFPFLGWSQDSSRQIITGIGAGIDVSMIAVQFMEENRSIYSASFDIKILKNYYFEIVSGIQKVAIEKEFYHYTSNGWFGKAGMMYDFGKKSDHQDQSLTFVGFRFGYAAFNQKVDDIKFLYNYWGDPTYNIDKESLTAKWIELGGGIHTEILRNFLIGFSVYGRIIISKPKMEIMPAKNIPGFGDPDKNFNLGFEYWVSYRIPFR